MPTNVARPKLLVAGMAAYSILLFGSQAFISIGAGLAFVTIVAAFGPRAFWENLRAFSRLPFPSRYLKVTTYFMGACVLSIVVARVWPLEIGGVAPTFDLKTDFGKIWYFYWPLVLGAAWSALDAETRVKMRRLYLVAAGLVSLVGIQQCLTGFPQPQPYNLERSFFHVNGFFGFHLFYASAMTFPVLMTFERALAPDPRPFTRGWAWFFSVTGALALLLTFSRTLWVALPLGMTLLILVRVNRKWKAPLVAGLILLGLGIAQIPVIHSRLFSLQGKQDRYEVWEGNLALFQRRPITGVGWHKNAGLVGGYYREAFPTSYEGRFVSHAHNNFLQFLSGTGILGALGFLLWTGVTLWAAYASNTAIFVALLMFQINGLTQFNLLESKSCHTMMYCLGLVLFLTTTGNMDDKKEGA